MSEQDNIQVVQGVYAAFGSGDVAAFLDLWVEDCVYHIPGLPDILPWAGTL
jgi:ketosteroid isomerase-like protein